MRQSYWSRAREAQIAEDLQALINELPTEAEQAALVRRLVSKVRLSRPKPRTLQPANASRIVKPQWQSSRPSVRQPVPSENFVG